MAYTQSPDWYEAHRAGSRISEATFAEGTGHVFKHRAENWMAVLVDKLNKGGLAYGDLSSMQQRHLASRYLAKARYLDGTAPLPWLHDAIASNLCLLQESGWYRDRAWYKALGLNHSRYPKAILGEATGIELTSALKHHIRTRLIALGFAYKRPQAFSTEDWDRIADELDLHVPGLACKAPRQWRTAAIVAMVCNGWVPGARLVFSIVTAAAAPAPDPRFLSPGMINKIVLQVWGRGTKKVAIVKATTLMQHEGGLLHWATLDGHIAAARRRAGYDHELYAALPFAAPVRICSDRTLTSFVRDCVRTQTNIIDLHFTPRAASTTVSPPKPGRRKQLVDTGPDTPTDPAADRTAAPCLPARTATPEPAHSMKRKAPENRVERRRKVRILGTLQVPLGGFDQAVSDEEMETSGQAGRPPKDSQRNARYFMSRDMKRSGKEKKKKRQQRETRSVFDITDDAINGDDYFAKASQRPKVRPATNPDSPDGHSHDRKWEIESQTGAQVVEDDSPLYIERSSVLSDEDSSPPIIDLPVNGQDAWMEDDLPSPGVLSPSTSLSPQQSSDRHSFDLDFHVQSSIADADMASSDDIDKPKEQPELSLLGRLGTALGFWPPTRPRAD